MDEYIVLEVEMSEVGVYEQHSWLKQQRAITTTHISHSEIIKERNEMSSGTRSFYFVQNEINKIILFKVMNKHDNRWDNNHPMRRNNQINMLNKLHTINVFTSYRRLAFRLCIMVGGRTIKWFAQITNGDYWAHPNWHDSTSESKISMRATVMRGWWSCVLTAC